MSNFADLLSEFFFWDNDTITDGGHAISGQSTARLSLCLVHACTITQEANINKLAKAQKTRTSPGTLGLKKVWAR